MPKSQPSDKKQDKNIGMGLRILYADDEQNLRELMKTELPRMGHQVTVCENGREALESLENNDFDAVILDIQMPELTGIQVLQQAKQAAPQTEFMLLTGHATVDTAVEALRHGAFDYLTKPCRWAELEMRLNKIADKKKLNNRAAALETQLKAAEGSLRLIGESKPMKAVLELIQKVGPTDSGVLILGETGTGKELTARELHDCSHRKDMPFVPVNCGALPEHLVESELFGHRKGAFTGADQHRKGLFEVADGGTLFLDEVGELEKALQVKLLRFLESGEIRRVGDNDPFRVNVRVVCATNRDLAEMVDKDEFRQDLYFRINTFEVRLPPLRERADDIPQLANHLLSRKTTSGPVPTFSEEAIAVLTRYQWPGNIRELANVAEHARILAGDELICPEHLPSQLQRNVPASGSLSKPTTLRQMEIDHIINVLDSHNGHKPSAAKELGISLKTLYNKMNQREAG